MQAFVARVETAKFMEGLGLRLLKSGSAKDLEEEYHFGTRRINGIFFIAVAETL